ncbi:hypothetical protein JCGZ_12557 [Jatropha curcas]|uniref:VQ domain-containing protein n=1 Tax=Jatropha curcas TaxID=180498 RepID=A0A067K775_JATCU|nr:VQ motif-containing protein 9 [Jatropha curcas]KDP32096.1 hypothetical protein JCGZ_12557 [Jatropha curcas]
MELYSSNSSSSSSSSSSAPMNLSKYQQEQKGVKISQSFHSSLRSTRKPPMKPWKKPIAPLPPTPPKVYKVDPMNFRDLVQKLTGAPEQSSQRLQRVAPPPLELEKEKPAAALFSREIAAAAAVSCSPVKTPFSGLYQDLMRDTPASADSKMALCSIEFDLLSPSTHAWCSYPLLSPGTLSSLEQSTVL